MSDQDDLDWVRGLEDRKVKYRELSGKVRDFVIFYGEVEGAIDWNMLPSQYSRVVGLDLAYEIVKIIGLEEEG